MNSEDHSDDDVLEGTPEDQEVIPTELSGFTPEEQHRAGIIALLNQMFRDNAINPSSIADLFIEKKLGTVIILDDDDDEDEDSDEGVFAITAAINFHTHQKAQCLKDLKMFLMKKIQEHGTQDDIAFVEEQINATGYYCSIFLVNEKMINLPAQFTLVPLQSWVREDAASTDCGGVQGTVICILKLYKKASEESLCYIHPEEKAICDLATRYIDYPVNIEEFGSIFLEAESEEEASEDCPPFRRICFISAQVFHTTCIGALKAKIEELQNPVTGPS